MAETLDDLNAMLNDLSRGFQQVRLKWILMSMTKIIANTRVPLHPAVVENPALEIVDEYR